MIDGALTRHEPTDVRSPAYRALEVLPGLLTWSLLLTPIWVSLVFQSYGAIAVAVAVLAFDCYWFLRSFMFITGVTHSYRHMRRDMNTDWLPAARLLGDSGGAAQPAGILPLDLIHLCLIPTYTEPFHVLEATLQAIADAAYPADKKLVGIITRETDREGWANVERLRVQFADSFRCIYHIKDPLEPGVLPGKSAAMNYGGRWMAAQMRREQIPFDQVILTDLDSDYRIHPQYLAWLSYHHAQAPDRDTVIWQPVPLFHNNLWSVPSAIRVMSAAISQYQLYLHSKPHRLVAFSSYSCSLKFVDDVGYWDVDVIPEDSRFYWKAFFRLGAAFKVRSAWLPIYGDSPRSGDYAATHLSQYNQIKRWAWGVTDIPYVLKRLPLHPEIPLGLRLRRLANLVFSHLNWIFLPVFLMFGASIPIWTSVDFSITDFGQNLWLYTNYILCLTILSAVALIWIEFKLVPPPPATWSAPRRVVVFLQYFAYPMVGLMLSVLPALESHSRLLLGSYLDYQVTEKG